MNAAMKPFLLPLTGLVLVAAVASTAKIVPTRHESADSGGFVTSNQNFDPEKMVDGMWTGKVLPALTAKAGPLAEVEALAAKDADAAGKRWGYRATVNDPWVYVVKFQGRIVSAETDSMAATIGVDVDGDGKPDARVQIGPVIRGTTIRDSLAFVSFDNFSNQIQYAQFGKALNRRVLRDSLHGLPRKALVGRTVTVLGTYQVGGNAPPLVTPATLALGSP